MPNEKELLNLTNRLLLGKDGVSEEAYFSLMRVLKTSVDSCAVQRLVEKIKRKNNRYYLKEPVTFSLNSAIDQLMDKVSGLCGYHSISILRSPSKVWHVTVESTTDKRVIRAANSSLDEAIASVLKELPCG